MIPLCEEDHDQFVEVDQGYEDLKILFQQYFDAHLIDAKCLGKNISRFRKKKLRNFRKNTSFWILQDSLKNK